MASASLRGSRDMIWAHRDAPPWALRAARRAAWRSALIVFVAVDERPIGALLLVDELRPETPHAIRMLRAAGVARVIMLTGDRPGAAEIIGAALDLDSVLADRAPADKLDAVRTEQQINPTIMVGDGINNAPALAADDVGIAMGAGGASASSEAAQVVILANRLDRVGEAIVIAQRARRIAVQSIVVGMGLSGLAMVAATVGWLAPVPAAILQELIDVTVIVNALRALKPARRRDRRMMPKLLADSHGLSAMSRAHREILDLARLLARIVEDLPLEKVDHYLVGDAQRVIEAIEALVGVHTAQEEDIHEAIAAR
jgi:cation transport ATPase